MIYNFTHHILQVLYTDTGYLKPWWHLITPLGGDDAIIVHSVHLSHMDFQTCTCPARGQGPWIVEGEIWSPGSWPWREWPRIHRWPQTQQRSPSQHPLRVPGAGWWLLHWATGRGWEEAAAARSATRILLVLAPEMMNTWIQHQPSSVCDQGPFFFFFWPWARLRWAEISWAEHKFTDFVFFCFCVSWAHREQAQEMTGDREQTGKVSHVPWARLSCVIMAPLRCKYGSYLSPYLPASLPHPPTSPKRSSFKDFYE